MMATYHPITCHCRRRCCLHCLKCSRCGCSCDGIPISVKLNRKAGGKQPSGKGYPNFPTFSPLTDNSDEFINSASSDSSFMGASKIRCKYPVRREKQHILHQDNM